MVRAKFRIHNKVSHGDGGTWIEMSPVYTGSEENERFFDATPYGSISMDVKNEVAADHLVEGQEYYVDFTPAS